VIVRSLLYGALLAGLAACTPDLGRDGVPEAMEFDTEASPPRLPQPTGLVVNPRTGHIDFALTGTPLPADCADAQGISPAECDFDHYLESLDGFPTVTPAAAPATAELDPTTLTLGANVVVLSTRDPADVPPLAVAYDEKSRSLAVVPEPSWSIHEYYWIAVRGYAGGVRARSGAEVVGSPTMALLKQDDPLPCGASTPDDVPASCPALELLAQNQPEAEARQTVFMLESIRAAYVASGVWERLAGAGLPKEEIAVLWGFPTHSSSVAELEPAAGLVPHVTAANELRIHVQGPVDEKTVSAFVVREQQGPVVLMDLTAAASGDLVAGFPRARATFVGGDIVLTGESDFQAGHRYGVFITRGVHDPAGAPLAPAPISVLLALRDPLVDEQGHSLVSSVSDADAASLEAGRTALAALFDNPVLGALTGISRDELVYCFAFDVEGSP
jgi:hypothetical protein